MKRIIIFCLLIGFVSACKTVDYEWENFKYAPTPKVTLDVESSALPTFASAKVSFFNLARPDYATAQTFKWTLDYYDAQGRAGVEAIEVYVGFNRREGVPPVYPIVLSLAQVHPTERQFPLPSVIRANDRLVERVTEFPKSFSFTPSELAALTSTNLSTVAVNDYFLFKFIVIMEDGTRIVQYNDNSCDESRGELCDCRVGVRFKNIP
ncbi:hypothetical protein ACFOUP_03580 [Belliella kenyensis]|uniref:Lipoprotein n=1 Tax=Belliella kenyensis TaxID=1472724 RepID=A0ABV8EHS8_9BACT|nr:hypothetical protein [Belliella kenyensis]MCH7402309.1 hypothetical protein [Belliella kenyensis]MDN3603500.1 hypothetical protein [Belliella kenyensis]